MTLFSTEQYVRLVSALRERGYEPRSYDRAQPAERHVVFRHDVDMSLAPAAEMAALEASLGFASTYFVLVRSEFYNPFTPESEACLTAIRRHGHTIGLHFDAALYPDGSDALHEAIVRECGLLEAATGASVGVVSFHRPLPGVIGRAPRIGGRINVYASRYIQEMGYCSDSRGGWHHGDPLDHPAIAQGCALQLLTHPIWWLGPPTAPERKLRRFLDERGRFLDGELARHCTIHTPRDAAKDGNDE